MVQVTALTAVLLKAFLEQLFAGSVRKPRRSNTYTIYSQHYNKFKEAKILSRFVIVLRQHYNKYDNVNVLRQFVVLLRQHYNKSGNCNVLRKFTCNKTIYPQVNQCAGNAIHTITMHVPGPRRCYKPFTCISNLLAWEWPLN